MILTEDINVVVAAALNAQAALAGKAWPGRGPDEPGAYPYVVFTADADAAETFSGAAYLQKWRVRAAAYIPIGGAAPVVVLDVLKALATALTIATAAVVAALRNAGERVVHTVPVTGDEEYTRALRQGKDVLAAGVTAELLCQGDRSVA